jgi:hypothetical protein
MGCQNFLAEGSRIGNMETWRRTREFLKMVVRKEDDDSQRRR